MQETYLSDKHIAARYGVSRQTVWRWHNQPDFPRPVRLSSNCTRWKLSEIEKWEAGQEAAS